MDRKVRSRIHEEMRKTGNLSKEYVVELMKIYDEKPNTDKLVEQYYKSKADRIISSFKDENGIRDCFAVRDSQNRTKYIDISNPELLSKTDIEIVRDKQIKLKNNKEEIIEKVNLAYKVIDCQLKIEEYERIIKKYSKAN